MRRIESKLAFLRYPGGKSRIADFLIEQLTGTKTAGRRLVEPFVGSGSFFFAANPKSALLADINPELIDLYRGIRRDPEAVWRRFRKFPSNKRAYYKIRSWSSTELDVSTRSARTLYLNRTCFKGMWRHNAQGHFNIGYGGQDRRWVIHRRDLVLVSQRLRKAVVRQADFEETIDQSGCSDFVFVDPPYRPGAREMVHDHYRFGKFSFLEHRRLAATLRRASKRGVRWALTTSSHAEILGLFRGHSIKRIPRCVGGGIGQLARSSGEVLIKNWRTGV
jgi:DNA adenine methylase